METLFNLIADTGIDMEADKQFRASAMIGSSGAYAGASHTDKNMARWQPPMGAADRMLGTAETETLTARSQDVTRNNGLAAGAVSTAVDNVIGTGYRLRVRPNWRSLGKTKEWAKEFSTLVEDKWYSYAMTTACDAAGRNNFAGLCELVFRCGNMNGEAISLPLWMPNSPDGWFTKHQLLEPERISTPDTKFENETMRSGVEIDQYGKPVAYHVSNQYKHDVALTSARTWQRIPAYTKWGRKRLLMIADIHRIGQTRGVPWFSPVLPDFKRLDQYNTAEIKSAIVASLVTAFIETPMDTQAVATMLGADPTSTQYQAWLQNMRQVISPLDGGAMVPVPPGTHVQPFDPQRTPSAYESFTGQYERRIAAGIGMPSVLFSKKYEDLNYSNARMAINEGWRFFRRRRAWLTNNFAGPAYELWLEEAIGRGMFDQYITLDEFYRAKADVSRHNWIGDGRGWVDPVKEAQAIKLRLEACVSTLDDECAEQGRDYEEVLAQRELELELLSGIEERTGRPVTDVMSLALNAKQVTVDPADAPVEPAPPSKK